VNAAENDQTGDHRQANAGPKPSDAEALLGCSSNRVALESVETESERRDQADRVKHREPPIILAQTVNDGPGGTAAIGAVSFRALVELCERTFDEACRHADKSNSPHPEHGTRATECDRNGNTCDVAATNPPADGQEQRFTGRNGIGITGLVFRRQHPEHPAEKPDLDEACYDGEEYADDDQKRDQRPSPCQIADQTEKRFK